MGRYPKNKVRVITGGIGSGKSTFCNLLQEKGAFVLSADDLARDVVTPGSPGLAAIVKEWGPTVLNVKGELDRPQMAALIFSDAEQRQKLEQILHPLIAVEMDLRFQKAWEENPNRPLFYDCPLYFEKNLDRQGFGPAIVINSPLEQVRERLKKRDGLSEAEITQRLDAQLDPLEKAKRADVLIDNSGDINQLRQAAEHLSLN